MISTVQRIRTGESILFMLLLIVFISGSCQRPDQAETDSASVERHEVNFNVNEMSHAWLLDKLDLPEPYGSQAKEALNNPEEFEEVLKGYFLKKPVLKGLPVIKKKNIAENYEKGILVLSPNPPVPFSIPFDWNREDLGSNFLSQLHSLRYLPAFMKEFGERGNNELFQTVESVFLDWIQSNPYTNPSHPRAWQEGTVAARTRVLLYLLNFYKETEGPQEVKLSLLLSSIYQHGLFLTQKKEYRPGGNHGLRQDWGLLAVSLAIPELKESLEWRDLAMRRMKEQQIDISFSKEGVNLEHSPAYHQYNVLMITKILSLLDENGYGEYLKDMDSFYAKSNRYLAHVMTPAGRFPPVGDSGEKNISLDLISSSDDEYLKYAASAAKVGKVPREIDGFFPDAGQVIFRDSWGTSHETATNAVYIHMHAANHLPFGHRHADELSFVMHAFGRWWVLEAGKYGYDRNMWREYVQSGKAHNGYTFNGRWMRSNKPSKEGKDVYFEDRFVSTPELAAARAHSYRFRRSGVHVTRTFIFMRDRKTLVLLDQLHSPKKGMWEAYLHLAPDLEVSIDNMQILARSPDVEDIVLEITSEDKGTHGIRVVKGQEEPVLGWYSPSYRKIVPSPTLVFDRTGKDKVVTTLIRLRKPDEPPIENVKTLKRNGIYYISWEEGRKTVSVSVNGDKPLQLQLTHH